MTTITIKLPEKTFRLLKKRAVKSGKTVEDYIHAIINRIEDEYDITKDPIYNIKGCDSGAPNDLASRHDKYLYDSK